MADPLYELLIPYFDKPSVRPIPSPKDATTTDYLNHLTTLPLSSLTTTEPQSLGQTNSSLLLSLQSLSTRSHNHIITSSNNLSTLSTTLPSLASSTASLRDALPKLSEAADTFTENYNLRQENENALLLRRRKALLLSRNIDRLSSILDLPTLLSTSISTTGNTTNNYASALDLNAHIRRLHALYPDSPLISSINTQAEEAMQEMTSSLIQSLKAGNLKLAAAMRTISWLRRVAPELDTPNSNSLGSLFLVCRLANLTQMLNALEPLRELADHETERLLATKGQEAKGGKWETGQQTERFLKRYIEIFREQSFAIISMYRSIFPPASANTSSKESTTFISTTSSLKTHLSHQSRADSKEDPLQPLPSPLSTFPLHLISMLLHILRSYLPNVRDKSSRDSLLTQVLYCAGSLGRLGGDFSGILAFLKDGFDDEEQDHEEGAEKQQVGEDGEGNEGSEKLGAGSDEDEEDEEEWIEVMKKHRVLAGRLELMVGGK